MQKNTILFLDDDTDNRFCSTPDKLLCEKDLVNRAARLQGTSVGTYVICVNADRANFPSRVLESYLQRIDASEPNGPHFLKNMQNLENAGIDSNACLIREARVNHRTPWVSIRMNDAHGKDNPALPVHSDFWRNHPELWCESLDFPCDNTLDYTHECVRKRMLDFIAEVAERYDMDGILLDWMRWPAYFPHNTGFERRDILTQFMAEARQIVNHAAQMHGHGIELAVRVPVEERHALKYGLDAAVWARQRLIDWLFLGNFFCGLEVDAPIDAWRNSIGIQDFPVAVTISLTFAAEPPCGEIQKTTADDVRGVAAAAWFKGANGVYPFNFMDNLGEAFNPELRQAGLIDAGQPEALKALPRRHRINWSDSECWLSELDQMNRVPGFKDNWEKSCRERNYRPAALPAILESGSTGKWTVCTAWKPLENKHHSLKIKMMAENAPVCLPVSVNGRYFTAMRNDNDFYATQLPADCFTDGYTTIEIAAANTPLRIAQLLIDLNQ